MSFALAFLKVPISWGEIMRRTFKESFADDCLGMAAQLAYYFFFALFPALLFALALASYFPIETLIDDMFAMLAGLVPAEALQIITEQIRKISEGEQGGLMTLGMLLALWSSSAAMTSIIDTMNTAYDIEEGRPWWKVRLTAMALTMGVAVFILASFTLILAGPMLAQRIADITPLGQVFVQTWTIVQWPLVIALAVTGVGLIYYFAPDADQDWVWITPGAIFATVIWLVASLGFKYYVASMGSYTETYGAIGAVMVLMLWFYISALVILVGAEMNAEIEHASPYGKAAGEKVPGQRRKIGYAAMRAWRETHKGAPSDSPVAPSHPGPVAPSHPAPSHPDRVPLMLPAPAPSGFSAWTIGAGVVAAQVWMAFKALRRPKIGA